MRLYWSITLALAGLLGCGSHPSTGDGGGGASTASATTSTGETSSSSTGGSPPCQELHLGKLHEWASTYFEADILENIDGSEKDVLSISFWYSPTQTTWTGVQDLGSDTNDNFDTCTTCVNIYSDGGGSTVYFQSAGQLDIGPALIDWDGFGDVLITGGSVTNARFVESYVDIPTRISTPVPGGRCFDIVMGALSMTPPPPEWTCSLVDYDDGGDCDCLCGVIDPDCNNVMATIDGCEPGQTCDAATATCAGIPTAWTCPASEYGGGAANGCDCGCGAHDPDCDLAPPPMLDHCGAGETCNANDKCVPAGWTCDPDEYDDESDNCDCGCGVKDADCLSPNKVACQTCDGAGSCDTVPCADANSAIVSSDNAHCN